ncbi:hypothetical protein BX616_010694, partial [Lobosporangium transversale]
LTPTSSYASKPTYTLPALLHPYPLVFYLKLPHCAQGSMPRRLPPTLRELPAINIYPEGIDQQAASPPSPSVATGSDANASSNGAAAPAAPVVPPRPLTFTMCAEVIGIAPDDGLQVVLLPSPSPPLSLSQEHNDGI